MNFRVTHRVACILPLILLTTLPASAQDADVELQCRPDEVDMGDFCARRSPEARQLKPGAKRATPYRVNSLMPGHAGESLAESGAEPDAGTKDVTQGHGWGVQLGAFSSKETADAVARAAAQIIGGPFHLAPLERGERILWACIHGPFPDEESASAARKRLLSDTNHAEAFVKPLDNLKLIELDHASTQK